MLVDLLSRAQAHWPIVISIAFLGFVVRRKFYHGLHKYPGPFFASFTDLWRFVENFGRRTERTHVQLHRKYGDVVRLGPNALSFADPRAIKEIYGLNKGYVKSEFYPVQQAVSKGERLPTLFSTTDEVYHARFRRVVNNAFAMSSLVSYEPLVDSTIAFFLKQTEVLYASRDVSCSFSRWLQFYAFDVIGELTWSHRLGFAERNEDVDGILGFIAQFLDYAGPIGQLPFLDLIFWKNPLWLNLQKLGLSNSIFPVTQFALARGAERASEMSNVKEHGLAGLPDSADQKKGIDLLSKFTLAQHAHPDFMTDKQVLTSCVSMIFAGSETTAISLTAVFYFLLQHPRAMARLRGELDEALATGAIAPNGEDAWPIVSWAESQKLPYLDAVIQESFRLHPAAGLTLERVVPPQGATICGERIAGGTIVGCSAWVVHRREEVFGADVDSFRPERWLEAEKDVLKEMKATMFQFGAGARTCIGKNISLLEIYKLVPSFLLRFDIDFEDGQKPWKTHNAWFVRQLGFNTKFKLRERRALAGN